MNKELTKAKSHAELVVADLLRRTLNIYEHELAAAAATTRTIDESTEDNNEKLDTVDDHMLAYEERKRDKDDQISDINIKELQQHEGSIDKHSDFTGKTSTKFDNMNEPAVNIIDKMSTETTRVNDTLKLFNRKHKILPSIPETECEEKIVDNFVQLNEN